MTAYPSQQPAVQLTRESLDELLLWLDPDRNSAGTRYEEIRSSLIKIFVCRGCATPEDLADETIDRVAGKIRILSDRYVGDPALYFYGVAQMIWFEHMRRQRLPLSLPFRVDSDEAETRHQCLDDCFRCLSPRSRDLILAYYGGSRSAKIERRKEIANELGIAPNALWIRAHRIRESLRKCVCECVKGRAR